MSYIKKRKYVNNRFFAKETKYWDVVAAQKTVTAAGVIHDPSMIMGIQRGSDSKTRIGRNIIITSVMLRGRIILPKSTTAESASDRVRIIIFQDNVCPQNDAKVTDLLETADEMSFRAISRVDNFKFLYDKTFDLNASISGSATTINTSKVSKTIEFFRTVNIPCQFNGNTGTQDDLVNANIGVMTIGQNGLANFKYVSRVRFVDK